MTPRLWHSFAAAWLGLTAGGTSRAETLHRFRARLSRQTGNAVQRLTGAWGSRAVRAYWWNERVNAGDLVTPALLRTFGYRPLWAPPGRAELAATGSILELLPDDFNGLILGSGLIRADSARTFPKAHIRALRGDLTRRRLRAPESVPLGDPGLLADRLIRVKPTRREGLGLVPHYLDLGEDLVRTILRRHSGAVRLIDPRRRPRAQLEDMNACTTILSSSLHGLVFADALGIPSAWTPLSDKLTGGDFKFHDYFSAFATTRRPVHLSGGESLAELAGFATPPPVDCPEVKARLEAAFSHLEIDLQVLRGRRPRN